LAAALTDKSEKVRRAAAMACGHLLRSTSELVVALCRATQDPASEVRRWAVGALGSLADPATFAALYRAGSDPDKNIREDALKAIRCINAALQARHVRYYPPTSVPPDLHEEDRARFLKVHEDSWWFVVTQTELSTMTAPKFSMAWGTICEAPPIETKAGYQGQDDA
jgi:hypothetical protein